MDGINRSDYKIHFKWRLENHAGGNSLGPEYAQWALDTMADLEAAEARVKELEARP